MMWQFATPLGLLALGALLIPILIHRVRQPRQVVRVGSLRWLETSRRPVRARRWQELLLLILRCGLLAALALALAGIGWRATNLAPGRWLLVVPGVQLDAAARAEWESLRGDGFEPRELAAGFPELGAGTAPAAGAVAAWSLLRELEQQSAAGSRAVVFGPTWSEQFRGSRPILQRLQVSWREVAGPRPVPAKEAPPRVGFAVAQDRTDDVRYLRAALSAIGSTVEGNEDLQWIFQLGDAELPPAWARQVELGTARLVTDAPTAAPVSAVARSIEVAGRRVHLRQRATVTTGAVLQRDSAGEPWLTEEKRGQGTHWHFTLRFHPEWSDWVLGSAFPIWWRSVLHGGDDAGIEIGPEQAEPRFVASPRSNSGTAAAAPPVDLRTTCWGLAALLFAGERFLSHRARRMKKEAA